MQQNWGARPARLLQSAARRLVHGQVHPHGAVTSHRYRCARRAAGHRTRAARAPLSCWTV